MIHLTFDQDWAPAWATRCALEWCLEAGLEPTFFVTHDCSAVRDTAHLSGKETGVELGWHPNFLPGSSHGGDMSAVLDFMAALVPEAVGVRAHTLIRGTPHLMAYQQRAIRYDASDLHDGVHGLAPFASWTGVLRIPTYFLDDVHLRRGRPIALDALELGRPGLKVLAFHPVLLALNAVDFKAYEALKADLSSRGVPLTAATQQDFAPFRQSERPGVADLLREVIGYLAVHPSLAGGGLRHVG
ncbi:MAG: hypothetical protein ACI9WU_005422 [Myxococcota bacterium]